MIGLHLRSWSRRRTVMVILLGVAVIGLVGLSLIDHSTSWPIERVIPRAVNPLFYRPDGRSLIVSLREPSYDNRFAALDLATGAEQVIPLSAMTWAPWTSPDGRLALYCNWSGELRVVEVATGAEVRRLATGSSQISPVFAADGGSVLIFHGTPSHAATVRTWDLATGAVTSRPLSAPPGLLMSNRALGANEWLPSPDGRTVAYFDTIGGIQLWDVAADGPAGGLLRTSASHFNQDFQARAFTPDSRFLLHGQPDGRIEVWDVARRALARTLTVQSPDDFIDVLTPSPDGRTLLVHSFPLPGGYLARGLRMARNALAPAPSQREDDESVLLDFASGRRLTRSPGGMWAVFSPDGQDVVLRHPDRLTVHRVPSSR